MIVNGELRTAQIGDVLAQGTLVGQGADHYRELPETTHGLTGTSFGEASVTLQVTSDCRLVVSSIKDALSDRRGLTDTGSDSMRPDSAASSQGAGVRTFITTGADGD